MLKRIARTAFCYGVSFVLFCSSCDKKKETPEPENPYALTDKNFTGKWKVTEVYYNYYEGGTVNDTWAFLNPVGEVRNGNIIGSAPWLPDIHDTHLTMTAGHSFFHTDKAGTPNGFMLDEILPEANGQWSIKNDNTLVLTTFSGVNSTAQQDDWHMYNFDYYGLVIENTITIDPGSGSDSVLIQLRLEKLQ